MTIKTKFSHPQKVEKESNMSDIKAFVFAVQATFFIYQIWKLAHFDYEKHIQLIPRLTMLFLSAVVIIGFLKKQKIIMTVHIWFMASLMAWPIFMLHAVVFMFFQSLEDGDLFINSGGDTGINMTGYMYLKLATAVFIFFLVTLGNLVYIALCYILLDDIKYGHPEVLPYTSMMHGSYQDSEKLIYPKI
ncbi:hypothetical protein B9Z55_010793 [Caenorhabditis nigoni]|uniref:Uncharacterized protein n=2 Tax=Caenorhabditis nigoni TaxID=1611254 RepID=A0A2G5UHY7_9PELO|nr:hypothetical protein B9Z55_010793 [Caenorhabditis nigoni]